MLSRLRSWKTTVKRMKAPWYSGSIEDGEIIPSPLDLTGTFSTAFTLTAMFLTSVQLSCSLSDSAMPWTAARQASQPITDSGNLLKLMSTESVMPSNHLILCCPLLLLPSIFPSHQGLFQWVSSSQQVAKVFEHQHWSFQWIFRTDFFRIDWFDLLAVQGTLKSLL